jgi:hypothetical protein
MIINHRSIKKVRKNSILEGLRWGGGGTPIFFRTTSSPNWPRTEQRGGEKLHSTRHEIISIISGFITYVLFEIFKTPLPYVCGGGKRGSNNLTVRFSPLYKVSTLGSIEKVYGLYFIR